MMLQHDITGCSITIGDHVAAQLVGSGCVITMMLQRSWLQYHHDVATQLVAVSP